MHLPTQLLRYLSQQIETSYWRRCCVYEHSEDLGCNNDWQDYLIFVILQFVRSSMNHIFCEQ